MHYDPHDALNEAFAIANPHRGTLEFQDKVEEAVIEVARKHRLNEDALLCMANRRLFRSSGVI